MKTESTNKIIFKKYKKLYINKDKIIEKQESELKNKDKIIDKLINEIKFLKKPKGYKCSVNGKIYENIIYNIVKKCSINGKQFNTQTKEELAGSSNKIDIECNFRGNKNIGIEVKKSKTPDWMQCSIKFDQQKNSWKVSKGKISQNCLLIFTDLINNINIYNGDVPPFMEKNITHDEWLSIKMKTTKWDDNYIDISSNTISKLYKSKGCTYIQISDGYGLYHLGEDICNFGVPLFNIEQQLRIRTKIHSRKTAKGFCSLSVTASCKPKNIKDLIPSKYSLDDKNRLPPILLWYN